MKWMYGLLFKIFKEYPSKDRAFFSVKRLQQKGNQEK